MQLTHYNSNFSKRPFPITLICDDVTNSLNIGGIFRLGDAFGVQNIIFCGEQININNKVKRTSRSTEKVVSYRISENIEAVVNKLKTEDNLLVALEITSESVSLSRFKFETNKHLVLIVGAENIGVSESVLNLADVNIHIDMHGQNSSMNVVQATGIALYEITKQII